MKKLTLGSAILAMAFVGTASAATYDFANLKYGAPFGLPGQNTGFLPDKPWFKCTVGDICGFDPSHNVKSGFGNGLTYTALDDGTKVKATGSYKDGKAGVVQDHDNAYNAEKKIGAGLGVYHKIPLDANDDNITFGETLTLSFAKAVELNSINLRSEGHTTTWAPGATFLLNGVQTTLADTIGLSLIGKTFTFAFDDDSKTGDQFYLGGLTASAVPLPAAALLFAPVLAGFGVMRRKQSGVA